MNRLRFSLPLAAFVGFALAAIPARAGFHLWNITEVYSNSDGSVQFIELFTTSGSQEFTSGTQIKSNAKTFTFPSNVPVTLPNTTGFHNLLIATAGFGSLPGGVTPDFATLPSNFFSPAGDHIQYLGTVSGNVTFASAPTNGVASLNFPGGSSASNTPRNFAGTTGSVNLPPPPTPTGDYNGNQTVDAADYTVWRDTLGNSASPHGSGADGDGDGTINIGDYDFWKSKFGTVLPGAGSGSSVATGAPEPTVLSLALSGVVALILAIISGRSNRRKL